MIFRVTYAFDGDKLVFTELIEADDIFKAYGKFIEGILKEFEGKNLIAFSLYKTDEFFM